VATLTRFVPCNGCTLCCQNDCLRILPEDDPTLYFTEPHHHFPGQLMLAHDTKTGNCIYLRENGCGIYDHRPTMCREMDCRALASHPSLQVLVGNPVFERGKELMRKGEP
jgi:hypothetical protein